MCCCGPLPNTFVHLVLVVLVVFQYFLLVTLDCCGWELALMYCTGLVTLTADRRELLACVSTRSVDGSCRTCSRRGHRLLATVVLLCRPVASPHASILVHELAAALLFPHSAEHLTSKHFTRYLSTNVTYQFSSLLLKTLLTGGGQRIY